jgi:transposase-like protein
MEVTQIDIKNVCRTCLLSSNDLELIFSSYFGDTSISQVLSDVGKIQIQIDDGLSNFICQNCKQTAINAFRFQQMCIESDRSLRILAINCDQDVLEVPKDDGNSLSQDLMIEKDKIDDEELLLDDLNDSIIYEAGESDNEDSDMGEEEAIAEESSEEESDSASVIYSCSQCPKFFKSNEKLDKHVKKHEESSKKSQSESDTSEEPRHVCKDCGREYKTKALVARHRKAAHGGVRRFEMCFKCDKRFPSVGALTRHSILHSDLVEKSKITRDDSQDFICVICGQAHKTCEAMSSHMKAHKTKATEDQEYTCKLCHESFSSLSEILRHAKNHVENATHQCTICNKLFAMGDELIDHFLRHKGKN